MIEVIFTDAIIKKMNIREINRLVRYEDESDEWPICGKFNVAERAIRKVRRLRREGLDVNGGLEYYRALKDEISDIVNDERNW